MIGELIIGFTVIVTVSFVAALIEELVRRDEPHNLMAAVGCGVILLGLVMGIMYGLGWLAYHIGAWILAF